MPVGWGTMRSEYVAIPEGGLDEDGIKSTDNGTNPQDVSMLQRTGSKGASTDDLTNALPAIDLANLERKSWDKTITSIAYMLSMG